MKENKKIDNRMKAKKLAAYTLATCMTVTVAPIGAVTPIMAEEVEMYGAADVPISAANQKFEIKNNITAGMNFKDAVNKITATDVSTESVGTLTTNSIKIKVAGDTAWIYNSDGTTPATANYKFEAGKKYEIEAAFDLSGYNLTADETIPTTDDKIVLTADDNTTDALTLSKYTIDMTNSSTALKLDDYPNQAGELYLRNGKGEIQKKTTVVQQASSGKWLYVKDGKVTTVPAGKYAIVDNENGKWYIAANKNEVEFDYSGIAKDSEGTYWYFDKSKVDTKKKGIVSVTNVDGATVAAAQYNVADGKVKKGITIAHEASTGKWLYVDANGKVDTTKVTTFGKNENGTWYITANGEVDFKAQGLKADTNKVIDNTTVKSYFVKDGKVDFTKNATVVNKNTGATVIKDGVLQTTTALPEATVLQCEDDGTKWIAVKKDGTPDLTVKFAKNKYGTWYVGDKNNGVDDATVKFEFTGLVKDTGADVGTDNTKIYYVEKGQVKFDATLFFDTTGTDATNAGVTASKKYYIQNGVLTTKTVDDAVTHDPKTGAWYNVDNTGMVVAQTSATQALATNKNGTWVIDANGKVDFKATEGLYSYIDNNADPKRTGDFYVKDAKVQTGYTGWVKGGTRKYVVNGKVSNPEKSTVAQYSEDGKWYYADANAGTNDGVNGAFTGIAKNNYGTWYVNTDVVTFDDSLLVQDANNVIGKGTTEKYYFEKSKLVENKTGLIDTNGGTVTAVTELKYLENGAVKGRPVTDSVVHFAPNGKWYNVDSTGAIDTASPIAANKNGIWMVKTGVNNGYVDFTADDFYTVQASDVKIGGVTKGDKLYFKDGKFQSNVTGLVTVKDGETCYVKNGIVTTTGVTDIIQGTDGNWYFVKDGAIVNETGIRENANGKWYVEAGKVNFNKTGIVAANDGTTNEYYVVNGKMTGDKTGIVAVGSQKFYVDKSKLVTGKTIDDGVVNGNDGNWYYINNTGEVLSTYTGLAGNANGIWYVKEGKVDFTKSGIENTAAIGAVGTRPAMVAAKKVYIKDGKCQLDKSGIVNVDNTLYNISNGIVSDLASTDGKAYVVAGVNGGEYVVSQASPGAAITLVSDAGIAKKSDGSLVYVEAGSVVTTKNGVVTDTITTKHTATIDTGSASGSAKWYVVNGVVQTNITNVLTIDGVKYAIEDGNVIVGNTSATMTGSDGVVYTIDNAGVVTP